MDGKIKYSIQHLMIQHIFKAYETNSHCALHNFIYGNEEEK